MKKIFFTLCFLLTLPVLASHIVGGEFELLHVQGSQYRLNLIIYFDKINGSAGARDASATVSIYRKRDNLFIKNVTLPLTTQSTVGYTQPSCSSGEIQTDKLVYTALVDLPAASFGDEQGYYVSWERCCRNYTITNIYSEDPNGPSSGSARYAGQTFYLEFPPVVKNGVPFINSSPSLFPPLNDYACVNRPYYVDFAGVDNDGDSLVYSLTNPLSTHSSDAIAPVSLPQPYPVVQWKTGYGLNAITKGNPDLRISREGLITVTPSFNQGLFVFAVKVEEFRNKQKIGESRRDFQMLVVDCKAASAPQIVGKKLTDASFTYDGNMNVTFSNLVSDADRCIQVQVSDPDSNNPADGFSENIRLKVIGLNFKDPNLNQILPAQISATLTNGSTSDFRICFPQCPFLKSGTYQVGIIAMDDACSIPLLDTLKVTVTVEPPVNHDPYFVTSVTTSSQVQEGDQGSWPFEIRDDDGDALVVYWLAEGFTLEEAGMKVTITDQQNGLVKGVITWDAFCNVYDFTKRTAFRLRILVDDTDLCKFNDPVEAQYNLNVVLPGNADPIIDTNLTPDPMERDVSGVQRKINQSLIFKVTGSDIVDNDFLSLRLVPIGFKAADYGITFQKKTGPGLLASDFAWNLSCTKIDLSKKDEFQFMFIVTDSTNKCRLLKADTVTVEVKVFPPDNFAPQLTVLNKNPQVVLNNNQLNVVLGQQIILDIHGTDADYIPQKDSLQLTLTEKEGSIPPEGYVFANAKGLGDVVSTFSWNPDCAIFQNEVYENNYSFKFYLKDNKCLNAKADSVTISIQIKDVDPHSESFLPINVFTPNDDGTNDYYSMEIMDAVTGELVNILPPDNCTGHFEEVRIVNRWGNQVYESRDRNFRWSGKDQAAGVYYYLIRYSNREFKGALSLRN